MFNMRIIGIIMAVLAMLSSPFSVWLVDGGQASFDEKSKDFDKENLETVSVELYVTSTGEKISFDFEEYICGVLLAEVPQYFEKEAMKAMAVAARTYCFRRINSDEKYSKHFSADVCDDYSHCLGYISIEEAKTKWGEENANKYYDKIKEAVYETKGEILYYDDCVADTVFHASSSGFTESAKNIWGYDIPYLVSVETPEEATLSSAEYTANEFRDILEREGVFCDFEDDSSSWLKSITRDKNSRVESVLICDKTITGRRMREIFSLKSTCFEILYEDGIFKFEVKGNGHGVGLSQYGCQEYAKNGYEYRDILAHYYPDTSLGLY